MSDQCRRLEIHGLTVNQAKTAVEWISGLDQTGVSFLGMEYTAAAGNPELAQNVLRINMAGPNISGMLTRIRNAVQNRLGRPPDLDEGKTSDLQAIRDAWQTYGGSLENRPLLKSAIYDIWRNGARCMSGQDSATLHGWLRSRGINSIRELKSWLDET